MAKGGALLARVVTKLEIPALIAVPLILLLCAAFGVKSAGLLTLLVACAALLVFFAGFELSRPSMRQILPAVVLGALAAAGRILFAAIPDFKPVSAMCILAGVVFGRRTGFLVGALAALASNFFFGHGPWTPWQMYAWGMIGYTAGLLQEKGAFKYQAVLYVFGFLSGILYGLILNTWHIVGFVQPLTWESALIAYGASMPFDIMHGVSTVVFLLVIYAPWRKKLERIREKYELV
ncbi:MAG: ECF transporter S component [Raoultibacter sp.]|jgi:energy-coupling factor transport system substrate-specific component